MNWHLRIMSVNSMVALGTCAVRHDLKPSPCPRDAFDSSMIWWKYLTCLILTGISCCLFIWSSAVLLAPLLSIVTMFGTALCPMALSKKYLAADASRLSVGRKLTVLPRLSPCDREFLQNFALGVGLIHPPAFTNGVLIISKRLFQQGQEPDCPAID
jgi:hypothetical protein